MSESLQILERPTESIKTPEKSKSKEIDFYGFLFSKENKQKVSEHILQNYHVGEYDDSGEEINSRQMTEVEIMQDFKERIG